MPCCVPRTLNIIHLKRETLLANKQTNIKEFVECVNMTVDSAGVLGETGAVLASAASITSRLGGNGSVFTGQACVLNCHYALPTMLN